MADNSTIEVIKAVGAIITPITLALITVYQIKISRKQTVIHGQIDGMKTELVNATAGKFQAEGELKGRADAKSEGVLKVTVEPLDAHVTDEDAKKVADTVVDTVKKDPEIEVKKTTKPKTK